MKKEPKTKIELDGNRFVAGILYRVGIHNLPNSIVKQFDKADYKILSTSQKKKKKKKTKDITRKDKETVDIETDRGLGRAFKSEGDLKGTAEE